VPTLVLNDGGTASYTGGTGTTALTFSYTVATGQNTPDLVISSFNPNGATVQDAAKTNADLSGATNYNPAGILQIETTAPAVTITSAGGVTIQATQIVTGTVGIDDAGSTVTVFDGSTRVGTATVQANGSWSAGITLANGANTLTAQDTDAAGNVGTSNAVTFTVPSLSALNLFGTVTHDVTSPGGDIYALYETILGRAPDVLSYEYWTAQFEGGAPITSIARDFLASDEYTSKFGPYTQSSDSGFVDQLYQNGLHRHAEPNGLAYWDTQLANGANSRPQTAVDIALSQESQNDLAPVFQAGVFVPSQADAEIARLFYGVLGRAPDPNGLAYWENDFAQGDSLTKIASDFLNSAEYTQNFGTPNNTQFVNALYEGALGRSSDPMGGQYWINSLDQGASRASVAVNIAESPEAMSHLSSQIEAGFKIV
jgi:hypothetical protein